ncbi:M10 family metallopeptidase C-terminal domain-containing protein [Pseudomonas sp. W5-01]|uniref:M10 family metallopeptidase C-terminal domain-containing protein n=1 Tax=Pseudomonas sp. W5-01 TaxID=3097454 RepID=UPI00397E232F
MADQQKVFWYGTAGKDEFFSSFDLNVIYGGAGDDYIEGRGDSVLIGGAGSDSFYAYGNAVLRYGSISDSSGSQVDYIDYFDKADRLDLTALGISGIGDGTHGTVQIVSNTDDGYYRTILRSYDVDENGNRFELLLSGDYTLTNANFQRLIAGSDSGDSVVGTSAGAETLMGYEGRDTLTGLAGDDRLVGGGGGDTLTGGTGADEFVFSSVSDSIRTSTGSAHTAGRDLVTDFNAAEGDLVDLSSLGFSGLGNGFNGTLKVVVNGAGTQTALKSLEADADGNQFEILFSGNLRADLNRDTVDFGNTSGPKIVNTMTRDNMDVLGTGGNDVLAGGVGDDQMVGFQGNDIINGGAGNDVMAGGMGKDTLTGGSGLDDFVYYRMTDSYRTADASHSDLITDFESGDRLFILDLGFDRTGDGRNGTLKLDYNEDQDRTYLRSFEADADGRFFQIALNGNHTSVPVVYDGLYLDEPLISIVGINPAEPAPM